MQMVKMMLCVYVRSFWKVKNGLVTLIVSEVEILRMKGLRP